MTVRARIASAARVALALAWLGTWWLALGVPAIGTALASRPAPHIEPPPGLGEPVRRRVGDRDRVVLGRSFRERVGAVDGVGGITHLHLEGSPTEIGWCHGVLAEDALIRLERDMVGQFLERVPSFFGRHLLLGLVHWNNRDLDHWFTRAELDEIAAVAVAHRRHRDPFARMGPGYLRSLNYHALHDVSQYLIDNPLVHPPQIGCTALAVRGPRVADGHLLVGRLFDFEGGRAFDVDKVVITCKPDEGIPFVSVVWNGMAGAVTGLNRAGIWISINAAATDPPPGDALARLRYALTRRFIGRPIVMVVRDVLQHCRTIDEAVRVIQRAEVFVSDAVLIASRDEGKAVCVEKGPTGCAVRAMDDDRLVVTNHFLEPSWAGDAANRKRIERGTTAKRFARARGLIDARPTHTPESLLEILRDRRGADGADIGFGNRGTINAWIGAHLVVCDVSAGVLWVCEPSHGLGRAIPFTVDGPADDRAILPASEDLALQERAEEDYQATQDAVVAALKDGRRAEAQALAPKLLALNPSFFNANALAAQCADDPAERKRLLERALELEPAYPADREAIEAMLDAPAR